MERLCGLVWLYITTTAESLLFAAHRMQWISSDCCWLLLVDDHGVCVLLVCVTYWLIFTGFTYSSLQDCHTDLPSCERLCTSIPVIILYLCHWHAIPAETPVGFLQLTVVPPFNLSTICKRAFPVAGTNFWNSLLSHMTSVPSLAILRQYLKTFLFCHSSADLLISLLTATLHCLPNLCYLGHTDSGIVRRGGPPQTVVRRRWQKWEW